MIPKQTQEPITTDVPLGLDEPAPILVWKRSLGRIDRPHYCGCFLTKEACLRAELLHRCIKPGRLDEPIQMTLDSVLAFARSNGAIAVHILDNSLRVIEEYPL